MKTFHPIKFTQKAIHGLSISELRTLEKNVLHRRWLDGYLRLKLFVDTFGRLPYQKEQHPKGIAIGSWVRRQRIVYNTGKMLLWRYKLLAELGFDWGKQRESWEDKYKKAKQLQDKKGAPLSRYSATEGERLMKQWLYIQQKEIKNGRLAMEKAKMLYEAGLIVDRIEYRWSHMYDKLKRFIQKNGRLPSAWHTDKNEKSLGKWRMYQVRRMRDGFLTEGQKEKMNALRLPQGILGIQWHEKYKKVSLIVKKCLSAGCIYGKNGIRESLGNELSVWWRDQRSNYRNKKLTKEQMEMIKKSKLNYRVSELLSIFS